MKDRRRTNRRLRRDRRWSDDRRTEEVLRLYAALGGATVLALRRMAVDSDENPVEGIAAPDRRRGSDRRARDRRAASDRRQLNDPAVVMLAAEPIEARRAPEQWDEEDFAGLKTVIRAETERLTELKPPESWSRDRDFVYRTVRAWSLSVVRLTRSVLDVLQQRDVASALTLTQDIRERVLDLCLLESYPEHDRAHAAVRALLFQALAYQDRHPIDAASSRLEHTVRDLKDRVDRQTYLEIEQLVRDPTNHWSSLGAKERADRAPAVRDDRLAQHGLMTANPTSLDLHELDILTVAPNVKDYRPRTKQTPADVNVVALQVWDWVLAAITAARASFSKERPAAVH